jgi:hypothetical protein
VATTDPKQATYIKVATVTRQVKPAFLAAIGAGTNDQTSATAMAESNFTNCAPVQSFVCNPFEATETNPGNANNFSKSVSAGTMFLLENGAGAAGNWGLIDPPAPLTTNPHDQASFWAQTSAGSCVGGVGGAGPGTTRTGNVPQFAADGMNVRFDQPPPKADGVSAADDVAAPIVIDGLTSVGAGNSCASPGKVTPPTFDPTNYSATCNSTTLSTYSCPLPRDRTFTNLIGNGPNLTDLQAYWKNHHSGNLPGGLTTRYQIYQQEASGAAPFTAASDAAQPHGPQCVPNSNDPTRRVINVAVVDCTYWGITGKKALPRNTLYAKFFMTEPATNEGPPSTQGRIYGEYIGSFVANTVGSALHQLVQLVR